MGRALCCSLRLLANKGGHTLFCALPIALTSIVFVFLWFNFAYMLSPIAKISGIVHCNRNSDASQLLCLREYSADNNRSLTACVPHYVPVTKGGGWERPMTKFADDVASFVLDPRPLRIDYYYRAFSQCSCRWYLVELVELVDPINCSNSLLFSTFQWTASNWFLYSQSVLHSFLKCPLLFRHL